jgi:hypothetical protein
MLVARHGCHHHVCCVQAVHVVGREGGALRPLANEGCGLHHCKRLQAGLHLRPRAQHVWTTGLTHGDARRWKAAQGTARHCNRCCDAVHVGGRVGTCPIFYPN